MRPAFLRILAAWLRSAAGAVLVWFWAGPLVAQELPNGAPEGARPRSEVSRSIADRVRADVDETSLRWFGIARIRYSIPLEFSVGAGAVVARVPASHDCSVLLRVPRVRGADRAGFGGRTDRPRLCAPRRRPRSAFRLPEQRLRRLERSGRPGSHLGRLRTRSGAPDAGRLRGAVRAASLHVQPGRSAGASAPPTKARTATSSRPASAGDSDDGSGRRGAPASSRSRWSRPAFLGVWGAGAAPALETDQFFAWGRHLEDMTAC